ncbi:MAG TPA: ATP synthase subunit I [Smithella sp.]|nr:ATP synthase subunit I [Smithella sp.]MDM7987849.1 ATP synthase subunit I [Smithella sp.]HNY50651.1 ATP synthase subunit I [Smithella sp.]HOG89106.1 ATP synthase subunit I [Smithella sp.]HOU50226.1 ATP synthase subunit I [Smithella sp.]
MSHHLDTASAFALIAAFAAGLVLGAFYFTALWHTVRRLSTTHSAARLMIGSFILRMAVVMAGFYLVMGHGHWERLAAAMFGFVVMRKILTYRLGPQNATEPVQ